MTHPQDLGLAAQARAIASGDLAASELLKATLERIAERNPQLNAIIATFPEQSRQMLDAAPPGPLYGVPISVKDMFGLPWRGYHNGTRLEVGPRVLSGPVRRLAEAGAVVAAVENQHELGMGTTGAASPHGPARNPVNLEHCPGGSSSGSASAVGGHLVAGALGSDSGGSARLPAGWSGVVGLKITYGSVPYDGYAGANSSLSAPGVFARDSADARVMAEALLGRQLPAGDGPALRVGIVRTPFWDDLDPEVAAACEAALAGFTDVREITLTSAVLSASAGAVRVGAELGAMVPDGVIDDVEPLTRALLQFGALHPARRLIRADRVRAAIRRELAGAFADVDVVAWPTNPAPAPPLAAPVLNLPSGPALPDGPNLRQAVIANLAGVPGISIPVGLHSSGLPIGLQLLSAWGEEGALLDAADHLAREPQFGSPRSAAESSDSSLAA
jgi:aspartyl-tRNA(Asn)/glutamyl-tRNA(Gln) amidotransferase subunit A